MLRKHLQRFTTVARCLTSDVNSGRLHARSIYSSLSAPLRFLTGNSEQLYFGNIQAKLFRLVPIFIPPLCVYFCFILFSNPRGRHRLTGAENLFGHYYEKGDLVDKSNVPSVEGVDDPLTNANRYVLADITSFFTLLVGIYFPSVTGGRRRTPCCVVFCSSGGALFTAAFGTIMTKPTNHLMYNFYVSVDSK